MSDEEISLKIEVDADTDDALKNLSELEKKAESFAKSLTSSLKAAVFEGKDLSSVLNQLALSMSNQALGSAIAPVENMVSSAFSGFFNNVLSSVAPFGAANANSVTAFAKGGIVSSPAFFPMQNGGSVGSVGMMGEAGAEAILPLARGADGSLGVASAGPQNSTPMQITFNVTSPDAGGFAKSEAQISAMLARVVSRGQRGL